MKQAKYFIVAAGAFAFLWFVASGPLSSQDRDPAAQQEKVVQKWEYAVLETHGSRVTWQTPKKIVKADSFQDFQKALGIAGEPNTAAVLSKFGAEGWELHSYTDTPIMSGTGGGRSFTARYQYWTFKRPVK